MRSYFVVLTLFFIEIVRSEPDCRTCKQDAKTSAPPPDEMGLVWDPYMKFHYSKGSDGCSLLRMRCSGYQLVTLWSMGPHGEYFTYDDKMSADPDELLFIDYSLPCSSFGWGPTADSLPVNDTFYCSTVQVGPADEQETTMVPLVTTDTPAADVCPAGTPFINCNSEVVIILDQTSYLTSTQIALEFNFVQKQVFPSLGWDGKLEVGVMAYKYGMPDQTKPLSNDRDLICMDTVALQRTTGGVVSDPSTLVNVLTAYKSAYYKGVKPGSAVLLFSGSTNRTDVALAAAMAAKLTDVRITVIALNGADFSAFNSSNVIVWNDMSTPPVALYQCMLRRACDDYSYCDVNSFGTTDYPGSTAEQTTNTPTELPDTTEEPSTATPYRSTRLITTTSAAPGPSTQGPTCTCDYTKVWNDVIYLFDSSDGASAQGLQQMLGAVQTASGWFNIQKSGYALSNYSMQVGIITYASKATMVYPLGSMDGDDMDNIDSLPFNAGDRATNLEAALRMAADQFKTSAHRASSKKVIVVMATTYNPAGVTAPQMIANEFKEDGGILVVYDYVQEHGEPAPQLEEIASPGFFLYGPDSTTDDLKVVQCDANCFCPINYASLSNDARGYPNAGCYYASEVQGNQKVANNGCKKFNSGFLASDENMIKSKFLQAQYFSPSNFYIGLTFDTISRQWVWADGKPLSQSYQPWLSGSTPKDSSNGACVYVEKTSLQWVQTDCRNGYLYTCEAPPCDSTHFCVGNA